MSKTSEATKPSVLVRDIDKPISFEGVTESWLCVDCGVNTAPGILNRAETASAFAAAWARGEQQPSVPMGFTFDSEVYTVRAAVWKAAGMEPFGGCLCVGCLEKRLGRKLRPKDFADHIFNEMPATPRLMRRQKRKTALMKIGH